MIITFAGHSVILLKDKTKKIVKEQIRKYILEDSIICYLGGYGEFDEICASACREIKKEYENVELVYVTPYLNISEQLKIKEMIIQGVYDSSVYPPIEKTPLRYAILKRNEWMMKNADIVIAYINHNINIYMTVCRTR